MISRQGRVLCAPPLPAAWLIMAPVCTENLIRNDFSFGRSKPFAHNAWFIKMVRSGQRAAPIPVRPGSPVGKALPYRYALRNGRKLMAKLNVNGKIRDVRVEADTPLLWVIREHVGLTGTKYGCGVAQCGACSVHINGEVKRSCSIPVGDVKATDKIVTIEGLSASSSHPVQKAWATLDVPQCGYCQSGQIMAAAALLKKNSRPTDKDIDEVMTNICRCGTYQRVREAVHLAAGTATTGRGT